MVSENDQSLAASDRSDPNLEGEVSLQSAKYFDDTFFSLEWVAT